MRISDWSSDVCSSDLKAGTSCLILRSILPCWCLWTAIRIFQNHLGYGRLWHGMSPCFRNQRQVHVWELSGYSSIDFFGCPYLLINMALRNLPGYLQLIPAPLPAEWTFRHSL